MGDPAQPPKIVERTFLLPPGVPKDRAALLKSALAKTLADGELPGDAAKAKLGVAPITGDELEKRVNACAACRYEDQDSESIVRVMWESRGIKG
jgi:hypothetical protein